MNPNQPDVRAEEPLSSWKEIGAYLQRNAATVRRWEKEEGLPVHRHSHKSRSSVYAFPSEIDAWRASRKAVPEPPPARPLWRRPAFALTLALCLVMVGNGIRPQVASAQSKQATRQVLTDAGTDDSGSPSPDGRFLTFTDWSTGDLAIRDLASGAARRLTSQAAPYAEGYAWRSLVSADSKQVAYTLVKRSGAELRLIQADGSGQRVLYSNPEFSYLEPAGFSPDGKHVLTVLNANNQADRIARIPIAGGAAEFLKTLPWGSLGRVALSPDGRSVAYDFRPHEGAPGRSIMLLASDGSRETTLSEGAGREEVFGWDPDGKTLLFASDRTGSRELWGMNVAGGKVQGRPERLRPGIGSMRPLGLTRQGSLYYFESTSTRDVFVASWDWEAGTILAEAKPAGRRLLGVNTRPDWSPDGKFLAYLSARGLGAGVEALSITIVSLDTGEERKLDTPKLTGIYSGPYWSPDGRSLLIVGFDQKKRRGAFAVDVATGGAAELVLDGDGQIFNPEWLPGGKSIVFYRRDTTATPSHLVVRDLESGVERELTSGASQAGYLDTARSPDGKQLAFTTNGEKPELVVVAVAGGAPRQLVHTTDSASRLSLLGWTPDSRNIIVSTAQRVGLRDIDRELWRIPIDGGERSKLSSPEIQGDQIRFHIALHPDGRRIAFTASRGGGEVWALENFLPKPVPAK